MTVLALSKWSVIVCEMNISVTECKQRCLAIIRRVERTGGEVTITRRGRVVAQLLGHGFRRPPSLGTPQGRWWTATRGT